MHKQSRSQVESPITAAHGVRTCWALESFFVAFGSGIQAAAGGKSAAIGAADGARWSGSGANACGSWTVLDAAATVPLLNMLGGNATEAAGSPS
eukprot:1148953-Pelagomonas_calceolata.AAC.2